MTTTFKWMALGAALGFSVAMGVSCGPAKCTAQNCAFGCCDNAGTCQMGSNDTQCGTSGSTCMQCTVGQSCQLGVCTLGGTGGNGGGFSGGGTGGSGGGAQGGGSGGGAQGGGGGTTDPLCNRINNGATSFFNGRQTCTDGTLTVNPDPNFLAQCNGGIAQCSSSSDRAALGTLAGCLETAQTCTAGNETAAIQGFFGCFSGFQSNASMTCFAALNGGSAGGGTGGGTPTGGGTGGGTPTGGGTGGGTPTGGGTGGGTPTGGGGGTTNACTAYAARYSAIMAGRTTCPSGGFQLNASSSLAAQCMSACTTTDQSIISSVQPCLNSAPTCTSGNEQNTLIGFQSCVGDAFPSLSGACSSALNTVSQTGTGGGGGGAPTGGGTGGGTPVGGGGGTTGCTTLPSLTGQRTDASYSTGNFEFTSAAGASTASDPTDLLGMEVIWTNQGTATGVTIPTTRNLATEGSYFTCDLCATLRRGCTGTNCTGGTYLGQTGTMTVSSAPRTTSGTFSGSISNVTFYEWNLSNDTPVSGGRCFIIPSGSITATVAP